MKKAFNIAAKTAIGVCTSAAAIGLLANTAWFIGLATSNPELTNISDQVEDIAFATTIASFIPMVAGFYHLQGSRDDNHSPKAPSP